MGGAFDWQLEVSHYSVAGLVPIGASEWVTMSAYDMGVVAVDTDTASLIQREFITYGLVAAPTEDFAFSVELARVIERVRIRARESPAEGTIATPGTLQITAVLV